jgi:hypothetical protein
LVNISLTDALGRPSAWLMRCPTARFEGEAAVAKDCAMAGNV